MKTRAFKKALSVLCVISMLLSVCAVCFAGTASAATTYTFNNSGKVYTADLESGAALEAPEAPVDHVEFLGWYDKTFTTKYTTAGSETELYAKYDANVYTFDDGKGYYDPNGVWDTHKTNSDFRVVDDPLATYTGNKVVEACNIDHGNGMTMAFATYNGLGGGYKLEANKEYVFTFKAYVKDHDFSGPHNPQFTLYRASDAGIGVAENKAPLVSNVEIKEETSGWVDMTIICPALPKEKVEQYPYLLLLVAGESGNDKNPDTTVIYLDDVVIAERTEKEIILIDRGVETKVKLKAGVALPTKVAGSFIGWYNKDLTTKYTTAPGKSTTLYAVYNGAFANFDKTGYWDPNNKVGTSNTTISVVNDPLGKEGKVALFNMVGNNNGMNFAPSATEGVNAGAKLVAGQYRLRMKYYATGVNEKGVVVDIRAANAAGIGKSGSKSGVISSHKITKSTEGWEELEIIFTVGAAHTAYDSIVIIAQDGTHYGGTPEGGTKPELCTAKLYVAQVDIKPYMDATAIDAFEMDFEGTDGFKWSNASANDYTDSTGNGYVTRGEILADANVNHYFQMKHFRNRNGYFWFTIDNGTEQFKLANGGLYTIEFDYNIVHSETPAAIGLLAVDPTKDNAINTIVEIVSFDYRDDLNVRDDADKWVHAKVTFSANTASDRNILGIYLFNSTHVPSEYATVVNFDNIVVTTLSISGEDGVVTFDDKNADFAVAPIIVEAGRTIEKLPAITKYGYDFLGWKYDVVTGTDKDGNPVYETKTLTNKTIIEAGTLNVYAEWKLSANAVELNFVSNAPKFDDAKHVVVVMAGDKITKLPPNPTVTGQKFLGWYLDTGFSKALNVNKAPAKPGKYTVYAKWAQAGMVIDYEEFDNKNHGGGRVSDRYSIELFDGDKALKYDLSHGSNNDPSGAARAQFYDGKNYIEVFDGVEYTITFKYYVKKVKSVGSFLAFTSTPTNTWGNFKQQAGSFTYSNVTDVWHNGEMKFTAVNFSTVDNVLSLAMTGDAVVYIDDVVISCNENPMNHYGSAVIFNTMGGKEINTVSGQPGEKFTLPRPKRPGYLFKGWFTDLQCTKPFTSATFGEKTIQIFAGWQLGSVVESFEDFPASVKALGVASAYKFYTDTSENYDPANIQDGKVALFRDGTTSGDRTFTMSRSQDLKLTIGSDYTLTMWVKPVSITNTECAINMVSLTTFVNINSAKFISKVASVSDLKEGEWQQVTYHFTATSEYVGISTNTGCDMYIDNISITLDGYTGSDTGDSSISPILVVAMALIAAGALLVTAKKVFVK